MDQENDERVKMAMATKLVVAMEPDRAKACLLKIIAGVLLYDAVLDEGEEKEPEKPVRKRGARKPRSDKGKARPDRPVLLENEMTV